MIRYGEIKEKQRAIAVVVAGGVVFSTGLHVYEQSQVAVQVLKQRKLTTGLFLEWSANDDDDATDLLANGSFDYYYWPSRFVAHLTRNRPQSNRASLTVE